MAALLRRDSLFRGVFSAIKVGNVKEYSAVPPRKKPPQRKPGPPIYHNKQKLENRGYLRPLKRYDPPYDVEERFQAILSTHARGLSMDSEIIDPVVHFKILEACFAEFQHGVPNSQLHSIKRIDDIIEFYKTPVDPSTPLEHLIKRSLPPNIHIIENYLRFDPETDTMFGGVSAFPKSGTIVSGLESRKKYKSTQPQSWVKDWREKSLGYIKWE